MEVLRSRFLQKFSGRDGLKGKDGASGLPLRLLLLGLVAIWKWNAAQAATRTVPKARMLAKVEMVGIDYYELLVQARYWRRMR